MKNNQLAIVTPVETLNKAVVPKPTKTEVIKALAQVKFAELSAIQKEKQDAKKALAAKLEKEITQWVRKNIRSFPLEIKLGNVWGGTLQYARAELAISDILPKEIKDKVLAYHKMEVPRLPEMKQVTEGIRCAMGDLVGADARVAALVSNPSTNKALKSLLVEIGVSDALTTAKAVK